MEVAIGGLAVWIGLKFADTAWKKGVEDSLAEPRQREVARRWRAEEERLSDFLATLGEFLHTRFANHRAHTDHSPPPPPSAHLTTVPLYHQTAWRCRVGGRASARCA